MRLVTTVDNIGEADVANVDEQVGKHFVYLIVIAVLFPIHYLALDVPDIPVIVTASVCSISWCIGSLH